MNRMRVAIILFLGHFLFPWVANSQGTIEGIVRDSLQNTPLPGANVFVMKTAYGAATDKAGHFVIKGVPAGLHTLRVSYIGYRTRTLTVRVEDRAALRVNTSLLVDAVEGEMVVVTAQATGQAAAINQQLSSNTITNVVSAEKILELPDANAAESVG